MTTPPGYNTLLECPYEKAHRIQAHAMSKHLFKCRKNHPNQKFVTCPFNESHRIAAPEIKFHTQNCEDRAAFDTYKYCISTGSGTVPESLKKPELVYNTSAPKDPFKKYRNRNHSDEEPEPVQKSSLQSDDECWDDMDVPAYNPQKYCEKANVIRKATLKTPSEKKAFYESERLRLSELKLKE
ncbi:gametocyte-specific factor 1 homolog [Armigeres subalbatus]|uniref:gametocyte-specific factor 1 homolog n=1 Tax=Armigeres subalbatus TaxID=124917 RepID=UPI002ED075C1